ncbi:MAG TPA: glycosyltransferase [Tepidisphaeraceae bacterium]|nr:glycosyltransferase [Tepidisphaeraceae bacterium]
MYVHQNFPAQFGHIAHHLAQKLNWKCTFVTQVPGGIQNGIERIQYKLAGGANRNNHFCTRTFENNVWHCDAVFRAMKARPDIKPDLIVGHSGFGSTLFLRELYPDVPVVNFFEYYYHPHDPDSDMDFRKDLGWEIPEIKYLRSRCRNAMILLDLNNCQVGYTPTGFQRSKFPREYQHKLQTIFDGVDRAVYHGHEEQLRPTLANRTDRKLAGVDIPAGRRIITYCSRGFESMRGFDIFMRSAKLIYEQYPDVQFLVIGTERIAYGGDEGYTNGKSFKQWVLEKDQYDLDKIRFVGRVNPFELGRILAATDLHIYLTVPFVLSWSMMDALSCGAVVLGSATSPVREMIREGENGLLADFFKPEEFAEQALRVLRDPDEFRPLGRAAEKMIAEQYSLDAVLPRMLQMYEDARSTAAEPVRVPRPVPVAAPAPTAIVPHTQPMKQQGSRRSPFLG